MPLRLLLPLAVMALSLACSTTCDEDALDDYETCADDCLWRSEGCLSGCATTRCINACSDAGEQCADDCGDEFDEQCPE